MHHFLHQRASYGASYGAGYNLRLIEYPNGSAQIRIYDKPMAVREDSGGEKENFPEYAKEPFTGEVVPVVERFEKTPEERLRSREVSYARTRKCIAEYARSARWEWFCTFTFSPEKSDRTNYRRCARQMRNWLKNIRDRKAPELQYLAIPELHSDMLSWHFHALLAQTGSLRFEPSGKYKKGEPIYNISGWTIGFSTATRVRDIYRVQNYIVKYMTKSCHILSKGEHRYFVSSGLPKPQNSLFLVERGEEEDLIQKIISSTGLSVSNVFRSKEGGYTQVVYIDLISEETGFP